MNTQDSGIDNPSDESGSTIFENYINSVRTSFASWERYITQDINSISHSGENIYHTPQSFRMFLGETTEISAIAIERLIRTYNPSLKIKDYLKLQFQLIDKLPELFVMESIAQSVIIYDFAIENREDFKQKLEIYLSDKEKDNMLDSPYFDEEELQYLVEQALNSSFKEFIDNYSYEFIIRVLNVDLKFKIHDASRAVEYIYSLPIGTNSSFEYGLDNFIYAYRMRMERISTLLDAMLDPQA